MTDPALVEEVARAILDSGEGCLSGLVYVDPDKAAEAALSVVRKALETPTEEMVALQAALRGDWHGVFLDGRNEHGSHVIMLPQRSIELDQDNNGDFLKFYAEEIIRDAEAQGFAVGHAVVATFVMCLDEGFFSHYEYSGISASLTAVIYGAPEEQTALAASPLYRRG